MRAAEVRSLRIAILVSMYAAPRPTMTRGGDGYIYVRLGAAYGHHIFRMFFTTRPLYLQHNFQAPRCLLPLQWHQTIVPPELSNWLLK
jgi:hypothetical protein